MRPVSAKFLLSILLGILLLSSVACRAGGGVIPEGRPSTAPAVMDDGRWVFTVDRTWDGQSGNVRSPSDVLPESGFGPVASGLTYSVVISERGSQVSVEGASIENHAIKGQRVAATDGRLAYDLTEGTFAGGRFTAWSTKDGLQGELTVYGSGRPIVKSERGVLVPAP